MSNLEAVRMNGSIGGLVILAYGRQAVCLCLQFKRPVNLQAA